MYETTRDPVDLIREPKSARTPLFQGQIDRGSAVAVKIIEIGLQILPEQENRPEISHRDYHLKDLRYLKGLKDLRYLKDLKDLKDLRDLKDLKDQQIVVRHSLVYHLQARGHSPI